MTNEEWIDTLSDFQLGILFCILNLHRFGDIDIYDCVSYVRKAFSISEDLKELSEDLNS